VGRAIKGWIPYSKLIGSMYRSLNYWLCKPNQIDRLVRSHDPRDLGRAMEIASDVEEAMKQMHNV